MSAARNERRQLSARFPEAYKDGFLTVGGVTEGPREAGGYPRGFHEWELERRNAWWAGANLGYLKKHAQPARREGVDDA